MKEHNLMLQIKNIPKRKRAGQKEKAAIVHMRRLPPTVEEIRERAHQIYLQRGVERGRELDDWLQAERELKSNADTSGANF